MLDNPNPNEKDFFGLELVLNLYECDLATISSGEKIREHTCEPIRQLADFG